MAGGGLGTWPALVLLSSVRPAAAAFGYPTLPPGGRWGNVLGNEVVLPLNGTDGTERWDDAGSRLGTVVSFALDAVHEHWGRCRECCHIGDPEVVGVSYAARQVATFTKDGEQPLEVTWRNTDGDEFTAPMHLGVLWTLRFVTERQRGQQPPPATAAEHSAALAFRTTSHDLVLFGDREGRFTVVRHTWQPEGSFRGPGRRELWTAALSQWYNVAEPQADGSLALICYNIWNFNGHWEHRSELIAKAIQSPDYRGPAPDILAIQEVRHDNGGPGNVGPEQSRHQVDHLLWRMERMGVYQVVWAPAMSYLQTDNGVAYQTEGPALMTRLPVLGVDAIQLTRRWPKDRGDEHQRLVIGATVLTDQFGAVNVMTSHLSLSDPARLSNVVEICRWAKQFERRAGAKATLLMGDLNMIPSDAAMSFLLGKKEVDGERCDFRDAWNVAAERRHELGGDFLKKGITFNNLDDEPKKRIDFVMVRGGIPNSAFRLFEVIGSKAHTHPDRVPPSDHLGLRVRAFPK
eukprot:TRINITY_DN33646_c0_g1_i1.p1 TRINITY_DN33646_c0_g1~~TRINITY_DN33646_c0_g1_i1.p1  ORF type:complete len:517 (+),score=124.98 TRINITY_DN33646_c0_g1_i1:59-1609(+)